MPGQYPTVDIGGPVVNNRHMEVIQYPGATIKEFKDGGASYGLSNANGIQKWTLTYEGLTPTEAGTLDAHFASANGIYAGFTFIDPKTSTTYSDVHYESYEYPAHRRFYSQSRKVVLVKRPI